MNSGAYVCVYTYVCMYIYIEIYIPSSRLGTAFFCDVQRWFVDRSQVNEWIVLPFFSRDIRRRWGARLIATSLCRLRNL